MATKTDLETRVKQIFREKWDVRESKNVPGPEDIRHSNDAVYFKRATALYADLSASTNLVDDYKWEFAAEIYKTYLFCAAQIIKDSGGVITSYDGDRVMGLFINDTQSTSAAKAALKINFAVKNIINPALAAQYTKTSYQVRQVIGIDTSAIRAARTGVRGDNDIVWVGRAANYAAKLTAIKNSAVTTWMTEDVYKMLKDEAKYGGKDNKAMWTKYKWDAHKDLPVYGSNWTWTI